MNRDSKGRFVKGHIPHTFGKHRSEGTKQKIRVSLLGRKLSKEHKKNISLGSKPNSGQFKKGQISPNKGKTKETSKSILSASLKRMGQKRKKYFVNCPICNKEFNQFGIKGHIRFGHERDNPFKNKKHTEKSKQLNSEKHLGKIPWNKDLPKEMQPRFGIKSTLEETEKRKSSMKNQWKTVGKEEKERRMKFLWESEKKISRPNKSEIKLDTILKSLNLPYKYVGDRSFLINWKNPDFVNVNGKKKVIELFGDYWHQNDNPQNRIDLFKKYGYECLVIWENELKSLDGLKLKLIKFEEEKV